MSSEINVPGHQLNLLSERHRRYRDFTLNSLTHAIGEIIACFPLYRSYVTPDQNEVLGRDHTYIILAIARAKRRNPALYGFSVEGFHKRMRVRRAHCPQGLLVTSTHDTKRGEDVRARINVRLRAKSDEHMEGRPN